MSLVEWGLSCHGLHPPLGMKLCIQAQFRTMTNISPASQGEMLGG